MYWIHKTTELSGHLASMFTEMPCTETHREQKLSKGKLLYKKPRS